MSAPLGDYETKLTEFAQAFDNMSSTDKKSAQKVKGVVDLALKALATKQVLSGTERPLKTELTETKTTFDRSAEPGPPIVQIAVTSLRKLRDIADRALSDKVDASTAAAAGMKESAAAGRRETAGGEAVVQDTDFGSGAEGLISAAAAATATTTAEDEVLEGAVEIREPSKAAKACFANLFEKGGDIFSNQKPYGGGFARIGELKSNVRLLTEFFTQPDLQEFPINLPYIDQSVIGAENFASIITNFEKNLLSELAILDGEYEQDGFFKQRNISENLLDINNTIRGAFFLLKTLDEVRTRVTTNERTPNGMPRPPETTRRIHELIRTFVPNFTPEFPFSSSSLNFFGDSSVRTLVHKLLGYAKAMDDLESGSKTEQQKAPLATEKESDLTSQAHECGWESINMNIFGSSVSETAAAQTATGGAGGEIGKIIKKYDIKIFKSPSLGLLITSTPKLYPSSNLTDRLQAGTSVKAGSALVSEIATAAIDDILKLSPLISTYLKEHPEISGKTVCLYGQALTAPAMQQLEFSLARDPAHKDIPFCSINVAGHDYMKFSDAFNRFPQGSLSDVLLRAQPFESPISIGSGCIYPGALVQFVPQFEEKAGEKVYRQAYAGFKLTGPHYPFVSTQLDRFSLMVSGYQSLLSPTETNPTEMHGEDLLFSEINKNIESLIGIDLTSIDRNASYSKMLVLIKKLNEQITSIDGGNYFKRENIENINRLELHLYEIAKMELEILKDPTRADPFNVDLLNSASDLMQELSAVRSRVELPENSRLLQEKFQGFEKGKLPSTSTLDFHQENAPVYSVIESAIYSKKSFSEKLSDIKENLSDWNITIASAESEIVILEKGDKKILACLYAPLENPTLSVGGVVEGVTSQFKNPLTVGNYQVKLSISNDEKLRKIFDNQRIKEMIQANNPKQVCFYGVGLAGGALEAFRNINFSDTNSPVVPFLLEVAPQDWSVGGTVGTETSRSREPRDDIRIVSSSDSVAMDGVSEAGGRRITRPHFPFSPNAHAPAPPTSEDQRSYQNFNMYLGRTGMVLEAHAKFLKAFGFSLADRGAAAAASSSPQRPRSPLETYLYKCENHLVLTPREINEFLSDPVSLVRFKDPAFRAQFIHNLNNLRDPEQRKLLLRKGGEALREYFIVPQMSSFEQTLQLFELVNNLKLPGVPIPTSYNGALRIEDPFTENPLGIFKPTREEFTDWAHWAKDRMGQSSCCEASDPRNRFIEQENELRAQELARILSRLHGGPLPLSCTPQNGCMLDFKGQRGVFVEFLNGYTDSEILKKQTRFTAGDFTDSERALLSDHAVFDFICGNLDSGSKNSLVKVEGDEIVAIAGVDFGNAWTISDPNKTQQHNQHLWAEKSYAKKPISGHFSPEVCRGVLANWDRNSGQLKDFFEQGLKQRVLHKVDSGALERMLRRYELVVRGVARGDIKTLKELAGYRTDAAIKRKLNEIKAAH